MTEEQRQFLFTLVDQLTPQDYFMIDTSFEWTSRDCEYLIWMHRWSLAIYKTIEYYFELAVSGCIDSELL